MSQEMDDLHRELAATKTVRASVLTLANSFHQRARLVADELRAAMPYANLSPLYALVDEFGPANRGALASSVVGGTSLEGDDKDVDPSTPPPASSPASLGNNVYGSKGPEDQPQANANTSLGYAGRDVAAVPRGNPAIPEQVEGEQALKRDPNTGNQAETQRDMGAAPGGRDIERPGPKSATSIGESEPLQDRRPDPRD